MPKLVLLSDNRMNDRQLMLISVSALLIYIKNGLLANLPRSPYEHSNPWDFYRECCRFIDILNRVTTFIDLENVSLFPDLVQVIERFIADVNFIRRFVSECSLLPETRTFYDDIPSFRHTVRRLIEDLFTTLCDKVHCKSCNS